jgi:hypothetical protein
MTTFNAGDTCLWCLESTATGSGKWVNRISADRLVTDVEEELQERPKAEIVMTQVVPSFTLYDNVFGYMCDDCQACDEPLTCSHSDCMEERGECPEHIDSGDGACDACGEDVENIDILLHDAELEDEDL